MWRVCLIRLLCLLGRVSLNGFMCRVVSCLLGLSGLSGQSGHSSHPGHSSMSVGLCALGGSCLPLVDQVCLVDHMRLVCLLQRCQFCIAW